VPFHEPLWERSCLERNLHHARTYISPGLPGELPEVVLPEWMELGSFGFVNAPRRGAFTSLRMTVVSAIYGPGGIHAGEDARPYIDRSSPGELPEVILSE